MSTPQPDHRYLPRPHPPPRPPCHRRRHRESRRRVAYDLSHRQIFANLYIPTELFACDATCASSRVYAYFFRIIFFSTGLTFMIYDREDETARVVASAMAEPIRPAMTLFRVRFYGVATDSSRPSPSPPPKVILLAIRIRIFFLSYRRSSRLLTPHLFRHSSRI